MNEVIVRGAWLREMLDSLYHRGDQILVVVPETMEHFNGHSYVATYRIMYIKGRKRTNGGSHSMQQ